MSLVLIGINFSTLFVEKNRGHFRWVRVMLRIVINLINVGRVADPAILGKGESATLPYRFRKLRFMMLWSITICNIGSG